MNFSAPFIRRPIATTLLTIGLALAGIIGFRLLPVAALPQVDFPTIQVSAALPGASPETMATSVAAPLERQFGRIAGVTDMTSTSFLGSTNIVLQFDLDRNIDGAARDVQAAINAARGNLPSNLPANPTYRKVNPADAPILIFGLTSDTLPIGKLYDIASTVLQQRLSEIQGVGQVFVGGSSLPAVRIDVNPSALSRYGLGLEDVRTTLRTTNVRRPKGELQDGDRRWQIETNDQLNNAAEFRPIILHSNKGAVLRLSDIATVEDGTEDLFTAGVANNKPAVLLVLFRSPGANIIETVERVNEVMPQLAAALPAAVDLRLMLDRSPPIRASLRDVERALLTAVALVIVVVFLFLGNVRAALIPSVAVPVSLIGTAGVMYLLGYSLDNLSLMALTIATGFVVDDAIVVLENISRHIEDGMDPHAAALRGAREITFTVLSMSASLVAVFIPILLMGGMVGRLFREFAVTLSVAIVLSLVVSITTTPAMCAALLRHHRPAEARRPSLSERVVNAVLRRYDRSLSWALRHPRTMLALTALTVAVNVGLFVVVPKGFFPQEDAGRLTGALQAAQDVSFQAVYDNLREVAAIIGRDPAVDGVMAFTGGGGSGRGSAKNTARLFVGLKPFDQRSDSADDVINRLRPQLAKVPGAPTYLQPIQDLRIGGRLGNALYQYTLQGERFDELAAWAPRVAERLRHLPQLTDLNSDQQDAGLQATLIVDRDTAARLHVSPQRIDDTLNDAFGQRQVGIIYGNLNQYHVILEVAPPFWQHPESLETLYVRSDDGNQVPLSALAHYETSSTTLAVNHQGQFPAVTLSFNLATGVALGDAVQAIEAATREIGLPATIRGSFAGTAQAYQASINDQPLLILAALVTVYIVLGILYESYVHPITILSTLPSAGVGAIAALLLCRIDLSVMALIGILLLIGIVKKNAIMMIDFAVDAERSGGLTPAAAIEKACVLRFRPIMMTTMAALFGALPLAVGHGVGGELRRPLGIAIVGGLIVSQALTLYTTPVIYLYLERLRLWVGRTRGAIVRRLALQFGHGTRA
ncbi:MAG TPA: multidrug efflux RND transporter permease subunit [Candidatus Dormibacteraeota bacterium]|nr:multidrug efflux RND transporter permease subunit [Candidatus Dormibacteraeota bacterium]